MLGNFQQSRLRIEVDASDDMIRKSLLRPEQFRRWLWPQQFTTDLPDELSAGLIFKSWLGPVTVQHQVDTIDPHCLRLLISEGIDGFHEWHWGDGWIQSCLEGVSVLPLSLGQTINLMRLRQFLEHPSAQ